MSQKQTGYETAVYELIVEEGTWDSPCKGSPVYKLRNKINGQIEGEGISLSQSIFSLLGATAALEEAQEAYRSSSADIGPDFGQEEIH